ncbi:hypothetical protein HanPSC8_Chr01g0005101 [Helianthus annuus]|nr:hypothetical protein HanPSC8_Chr01g0005101 [Helianthus annuus]
MLHFTPFVFWTLFVTLMLKSHIGTGRSWCRSLSQLSVDTKRSGYNVGYCNQTSASNNNKQVSFHPSRLISRSLDL